jgi:hypothetical protein
MTVVPWLTGCRLAGRLRRPGSGERWRCQRPGGASPDPGVVPEGYDGCTMPTERVSMFFLKFFSSMVSRS